MKFGCDTSFLLRILTNHPLPLATDVILAAAERIDQGDVFFISDLVLSEAYYALQASYGVSKPDALRLLRHISQVRGFEVSLAAKEVLAILKLEKASPGFVDRLIHGENSQSSLKTVACEKSFSKLPMTEVFVEKKSVGRKSK